MAPTHKVALPPHLAELLPDLPVTVTRRDAAEIISKNLFKVSHRSLERWPVPTRHVNNKSIGATYDYLAVAWARFVEAPVLMSGQSATNQPVERDRTSSATV